MDNHFTVLTWNVNGFSLQDQPRLLASMEWDLACLQEVTRESWPAFQECGEDGAIAFDHLPTLASSGPHYACAVLVRDEARLLDFGVVPDVPSPELQVDDVEHHLDPALKAGSDHAMVLARLSWRRP